MPMKRKQRNLLTYFLIAAAVVLFLGFGLVAFVLWNVGAKTSTEWWIVYGTLAAGILGPLFTCMSYLALYLIWNDQRAKMTEEDEDSAKANRFRNFEQHYFELLKVLSRLHDEIYYDMPASNNLTTIVQRRIYGAGAIIQIGKDIATAQESSGGDSAKLAEYMRAEYAKHSAYLRHYFDFILFVMEYVDGQQELAVDQKEHRIELLTTSMSYDEVLLLPLMYYDYDIAERQGPTQAERLNTLRLQYPILKRLLVADSDGKVVQADA